MQISSLVCAPSGNQFGVGVEEHFAFPHTRPFSIPPVLLCATLAKGHGDGGEGCDGNGDVSADGVPDAGRAAQYKLP